MTSCRGRVDCSDEEADPGLELGGGALERRQRLARRRPARAPDRGCSSARVSGCAGNSGQTSRTRSHSVITWSKRCRRTRRDASCGSPRCRVPRSRITRTALGCSGFGWLPALAARDRPAGQLLAAAPRPSASARCCRCTGTARVALRGFAGSPGARPGCSAAPAPASSSATALELEHVVGVAPVGGAPPRRHQPAVAQPPEVVRDEALPPPGELAQLADAQIALRELAQQLPAQWMPGEPQERRRRHAATIHQSRLMCCAPGRSRARRPSDRYDGCCSGGGGIRTHGPGEPGQRFSRPPHSTTLPPLRGGSHARRCRVSSGVRRRNEQVSGTGSHRATAGVALPEEVRGSVRPKHVEPVVRVRHRMLDHVAR